MIISDSQIFFVTGRRRREDGKKKVTNDGGSYGFGRGSRAVRSRLCQWYGICAETEDTTEQEYITADGCYTLWMVVKQTERSDKLVIVNHVLLDGRACKGKTPVHFKIYSIIDSEMDRGFCYIL